jgi:hypothetical protein
MKRTGLAWRVVAWLLFTAWVPVGGEMSLNFFFHIEQRFEATILIIPYMEFVTGPLSLVAVLIVLYKGARAIIRLLRRNKNSESYQNRNS